jgi:hypothetical protein
MIKFRRCGDRWNPNVGLVYPFTVYRGCIHRYWPWICTQSLNFMIHSSELVWNGITIIMNDVRTALCRSFSPRTALCRSFSPWFGPAVEGVGVDLLFQRRCLSSYCRWKWLKNQSCGENASFVDLTVVGGRLKQKNFIYKNSRFMYFLLWQIYSAFASFVEKFYSKRDHFFAK